MSFLIDDIPRSCPCCGQADKLDIVMRVNVRMDKFGEMHPKDEDWEYNAASPTECPECGHSGVLADFADTTSMPDEVLEALMHVRTFHPQVSMVVFDPQGSWVFLDPQGSMLPLHPGPNLNVELLQAAVQAAGRLPAVFALRDNYPD